MGKLTTLSNRAEVDRRTGINREGRSSAGSVMVAATGRPDFDREWLNRARGWVEELRGEAAQLGARGIEAGWRGVAGATSGGSSVHALLARARGRG